MKNTLLTTTAIALTGFAGAASAVEVTTGAVTMQITGYYNVHVGFTSADDVSGADYDGVDILTNTEIHFKPSITLDNGITIGADVELEGNTHTDQIDESTIFAKGDFGKFEFGSKDSAGRQMHIGAPDVSMVYANSTSLTSFVAFTAPSTSLDLAGDAERITYFTPDFGGFQLGVSYARDASQTSGPVNNNAVTTDYFDVGVSYSGALGGMDLGLSARYGAASVAGGGDNPDIWGAGIVIGFGNISFGGGYTEVDLNSAVDARSAYDIGVSYVDGPMGYSLTYASGERANNVSENYVIVAAATYKVNSNFKVSVALSQIDTDITAGTAGDIDATILTVSAGFNF